MRADSATAFLTAVLPFDNTLASRSTWPTAAAAMIKISAQVPRLSAQSSKSKSSMQSRRGYSGGTESARVSLR
jgi:hypothetical protein